MADEPGEITQAFLDRIQTDLLEVAEKMGSEEFADDPHILVAVIGSMGAAMVAAISELEARIDWLRDNKT
jgi:hypothetical protein